MVTGKPRPKNVFICYSHEDRSWLDQLLPHLVPLKKDGEIVVKWDREIRPGQNWTRELEAALNMADAAILLTSKHFFSSEFITQEELPVLIDAHQTRGCQLLIVQALPFKVEKTVLGHLQLVDDRPLLGMRGNNREKVFLKVVEELRAGPLSTTVTDWEEAPPSEPELELEAEKAREGDEGRLKVMMGSIHGLSILKLMENRLRMKRTGINLPVTRPSGAGLTIRDLEKLCGDDSAGALADARGWAFGRKYGDRTQQDDERFTKEISLWVDEVKALLNDVMEVGDLGTKAALNVGIGNGSEGKGLYDCFKRFIGVDISERALEQAEQHYPFLKAENQPSSLEEEERNATICTSAERLLKIGNQSIDVYLSFRTYQSTLFDKNRALYAAYRVLKPGGFVLISVPNKYKDAETALNKDNKPVRGAENAEARERPEPPPFKEGLLRPDTGNLLDRELPYTHIGEIRRKLFDLNFADVGVRTGMYEIYVYGRKPKPNMQIGSLHLSFGG
jgi:SAM-dependent methyltransferase